MHDIHETHPKYINRHLSKDEWIKKFGSGTLNKSMILGFNVDDAYYKERVCFEFGYGFECVPSSRITYSDIKLISCQALTELGWHAERMITLNPFPVSDEFTCKQLEIEYADGRRVWGAGIMVTKTSVTWLPKGSIVFAVVAEFDGKEYSDAINPF